MPARLREWLAAPVDALPIDALRVLVGALSFAYFLQTFFEARDFSAPGGLIDHELVQKVFWFTRIGLFTPSMSLAMFQAIFLLACVASLSVVVGYRVKVCAGLLYLIAVSTYRWNYLVMYVDDAIMHLMLFWLLLLPVGHTLVLREWLKEGKSVWRRWSTTKVPGSAVRCFLLNMTLIYLVAGLWKWTSPMWRNGTALYAVLKLPISRFPDFWGPQHLPILRVLNYVALVLETIFPLVFFVRKGSRVRYALLVALVAFHAGMILSLLIPFANYACIAATVVLFGPELMSRVHQGSPEPPRPAVPARLGFTGVVAVIFIIDLTLAMLSSVVLPNWRVPVRGSKAPQATIAPASSMSSSPISRLTKPVVDMPVEGLRPLQKAFFGSLYAIGIGQQYQLFNWIDERNYSVHYEVTASDGRTQRSIDPEAIFPRSTRGALIQTYVHGIIWMQVPPDRRIQLRKSIYERSARRYCRDVEQTENVTVDATLQRIVPGSPVAATPSHSFLMQFQCRNREPLMQMMNLNP